MDCEILTALDSCEGWYGEGCGTGCQIVIGTENVDQDCPSADDDAHRLSHGVHVRKVIAVSVLSHPVDAFELSRLRAALVAARRRET